MAGKNPPPRKILLHNSLFITKITAYLAAREQKNIGFYRLGGIERPAVLPQFHEHVLRDVFRLLVDFHETQHESAHYRIVVHEQLFIRLQIAPFYGCDQIWFRHLRHIGLGSVLWQI